MQAHDILDKLQKVKRLSDGSFMACCPAHADKTPSLHITSADDKILLACQAGCDTESVVSAMGLELVDLFTKDNTLTPQPSPAKNKIVATYDYKDEEGRFLYQVCRLEPKSFRQRHKNGSNSWTWDMTGVRRVLYHLDDIVTAQETIYLVEGEKDADKLWDYGQIATTSSGGANGWKPEFADSLKGKNVVIIPDNDVAGLAYGKDVARSFIGKVDAKCILLPKPAKDISDWIEQGGDVVELPSMEQNISVLLDSDKPKYQFMEDAVVWNKEISGRLLTFKAESVRSERTGIHARISIMCDWALLAWSLFNTERSEDRTRLSNQAYKQLKGDLKESYADTDLRRDFDVFCAGLWEFQLSTYEAEMVRGDDTPLPINFLLSPYIIEGGGTIVFAPAGRGKSFTALLWVASVQNGINKYWNVKQTSVLFINLERSKESVQRRVSVVNKVLGLPAETPMLIMNARGKSLSDIAAPCKRIVDKHNVKLVVLDSISRAGYGDLTENRPVNAIIDSLSSLCDSWVALAHTPRADESHVFGGVMFEAGADIVVRVASEVGEQGTMGIGYEITKSNDVPRHSQQVWAMEFNEFGLSGFRKARAYEFPEVEGKSKKSIPDAIEDFILNQDTAEATATEIADGTGFNRSNISSILNSHRFVKTRREKTGQYYGVASMVNTLDLPVE